MTDKANAGNVGAEKVILSAVQTNQLVPAQNSVDNVVESDVIGNKTDGHVGNSVYGLLKQITEHVHSITDLYPLLAIPVELTKAAGVYAAFPTPLEIIPAGAVASDFDIHWCIVSAISANGDYVIRLYQGAALSETAIATFSVVRNAAQSQEGAMAMITPLMAANTRISAAISSGNAAADTIAIKLQYHTY